MGQMVRTFDDWVALYERHGRDHELRATALAKVVGMARTVDEWRTVRTLLDGFVREVEAAHGAVAANYAGSTERSARLR